ncbi:MAG TPA: methyltransferase domain-containing protein [Baekduia sp.]|nr:methyltransferase domain-containing protein [Baekduia sp.]
MPARRGAAALLTAAKPGLDPPPACRICPGALDPHVRGTGGELTPEALAPSGHEPGRHGDLLICRECGAVQQPALPAGARLHDLYREGRDEAYLDEEAGRRATARRLLDLIGGHVPAGRLLDVGCGPGLLLDEARSRGYATAGLELSRSARRHATQALGLDVRDVPLEAFEDPDGFDVVVLADVLEHLDDPVAGIARAASLLRSGGLLCVVTPDPASLTARVAGPRWWGYVPAHTCLLPRRTLRELLVAAGLVVSTDVPLVRTFSARRWVSGLAERLGPLGRPLNLLGERLPPGASLSVALRDEPVLLAHRVDVQPAPRPLMADRGGRTSVHVVLPAYRAMRTLAAVVSELDPTAADRALLIDDGSPDTTAQVALDHGLDVLRHPVNRGYGASQKTGYARALRDGADVVVMVHADDQYNPALVADMAAPIVSGRADMVIGSRLLEHRAVADGMPRWKWVGNRLLTTWENRVFRMRFSEYHTGYRAFSADLLRSVAFLRNSDSFVFDQEIVAQVLARGARVAEIPIPTRYFLEASSVDLPTSVRYGLDTLGVLARFALDRRPRARWTLLRRPAARLVAAAAGKDRDVRARGADVRAG